MGNQNKTGLIGLSGTLEQMGCSLPVDADSRKVGEQRHTNPDSKLYSSQRATYAIEGLLFK